MEPAGYGPMGVGAFLLGLPLSRPQIDNGNVQQRTGSDIGGALTQKPGSRPVAFARSWLLCFFR